MTASSPYVVLEPAQEWSPLRALPATLLAWLLTAYRAVVSPLYGDVCKYYPSCSAYAVGAVQQHGLVKGSALTARRLARCHPWARGGVDDVPLHRHFRHELTRYGFVVPSTDEASAGSSPRKD